MMERFTSWRLGAAALLLAAAPTAWAADPAEAVRAFAEREIGQSLAPQGLRAEIQVGRLPPRARGQDCQRAEAFLAPGAKLWGRGYVGLRCVAGADWSLMVPVNVRVFGPALVTSRPQAAGQPIDATSLIESEVELTRLNQAVVSELADLEGRVLSRPLPAGQPVPVSALRAPQVIAAGEWVRVVGSGLGFTVTLSGTALANAQDGQIVRVRTEAGKVISGTARPGRVVEVPM